MHSLVKTIISVELQLRCRRAQIKEIEKGGAGAMHVRDADKSLVGQSERKRQLWTHRQRL